MGRYNLQPTRVHRTVTSLLKSEFLKDVPPWYETIGSIPPSEIITRPQPVQHRELPKRLQNKKPSKMFRPQKIVYEEDKLRMNFFQDHPWELARPRVILEDDGKDGQKVDWSELDQPGRQLNGESVVQRQLWLLKNENLSSAEAYDKARHEFYEIRHQQEVEKRIAKEEALAVGAYFGPSILEIGMQLEDQNYEKWKEWAAQEVMVMQQQKDALYSGPTGASTEEVATPDVDDLVTGASQEEVNQDT